MKQIILSCIVAATATATAPAQTTEVDTVKIIPSAQSVSVTRQDNKTVVTALIPIYDNAGTFHKYTYEVNVDKTHTENEFNADEFRLKLPFIKGANTEESEKFKPKRYITSMKYVYWGWNFNYDNKAGIKNSFELCFADIIGIDWRTSRYTTLGVGFGLGFNRVTSKDYMLFAKEGDAITLTHAPENAEVDFARLDSWKFQVPLMFSQKLAGDFGIAFATIVNFNTYSTATNRYKIGRTRYTETIKGLNQRLLTVDFMATIGFINTMGFYAKWSPMTAMEKQYGPSYRNFSIGVNLNF